MRVLITGVTGQTGAYIALEHVLRNDEVFGLVRRISENNPPWRLKALGIVDNVELIPGDVTDLPSLHRAMHHARPDRVYHLAAMSFVPYSWSAPHTAIDSILTGTVNVLEAIVSGLIPSQLPSLYHAATSEIYGNAPPPQGRTSIPLPCSPYGFAKLAAHHAVLQYQHRYKLNAYSAICFNHESPLRAEEMVTRYLAKEAVLCYEDKKRKVPIGNLYPRRDFSFAGDVARAAVNLLDKSDPMTPRDPIMGTGFSWSIKDVAQCMFEGMGVDFYGRMQLDESRVRKNEVNSLCADPDIKLPDRGERLWEMMVKAERLRAEEFYLERSDLTME